MSTIEQYKNLWIEKHRPSKLDDIVLDPAIKSAMLKFKESGEIPNLLFHGDAGGGKTSLSRILVNECLDCQYLYINASDENGVDTVRGKIKDFAEVKSIDGKLKVIILDEVDGFSAEGQRALRNVMEEFSHVCRFILTCNTIGRIIPPVVSRCVSYEIVPPLTEYIKRCVSIIRSEGVKISDTKATLAYIKKYYPDVRLAVNSIQRDSLGGELILSGTSTGRIISNDVFEHIKTNGDPFKLRKLLIERAVEFNSDYRMLMKDLFNMAFDADMDHKKKKQFMLELSGGLYRHELVMDKEINCYATLLKLLES